MKKCEVIANGKKYTADFYGVFQLSTVIDPSPMIGGHSGGVIAYPVAIVDFGDGDGLINLPIEEIAKVYEIGDGDIDALFQLLTERKEKKP